MLFLSSLWCDEDARLEVWGSIFGELGALSFLLSIACI